MIRLRLRRLIFLLLTFALLGASTEAKLSMYQPEHAPGASTSQVIKLQQVRIGTPALALELPAAIGAGIVLPAQERREIPVAPAPVTPGSGPSVAQSHWFRPPPELS